MDPRVREFHCIMPIVNIPSVLTQGILSYERVARLTHKSVAAPAVQDRRDLKRVSGGLMLHHYANLYFHARNPMMYARQEEAPRLCVLRISAEVSQLPGVVLTDRNASSNWVRFVSPSEWALLDFDAIYATDWRHPDQFQYFERKSKKCAEILVPNQVEPRFLVGAYVTDAATEIKLREAGFLLPITIDRVLFFR